MNKRKVRDTLRIIKSIMLSPLCLLHLLAYYTSSADTRNDILADIDKLRYQSGIKSNLLLLIHSLINNRYYRNVFYHRIGPVKAACISFSLKGDRYFSISKTTKIGGGFWMAHPYSTIINAECIGADFRCINNTTIGATSKGRPTIGNNVDVGANVVIIGNVTIGNNVRIGAGSVVVKDIPDNCVAVGNPAKPIKTL